MRSGFRVQNEQPRVSQYIHWSSGVFRLKLVAGFEDLLSSSDLEQLAAKRSKASALRLKLFFLEGFRRDFLFLATLIGSSSSSAELEDESQLEDEEELKLLSLLEDELYQFLFLSFSPFEKVDGIGGGGRLLKSWHVFSCGRGWPIFPADTELIKALFFTVSAAFLGATIRGSTMPTVRVRVVWFGKIVAGTTEEEQEGTLLFQYWLCRCSSFSSCFCRLPLLPVPLPPVCNFLRLLKVVAKLLQIKWRCNYGDIPTKKKQIEGELPLPQIGLPKSENIWALYGGHTINGSVVAKVSNDKSPFPYDFLIILWVTFFASCFRISAEWARTT